MQSSKIFQLIKSLNDKEKSAFKKTLSNNKRKTLSLLYKLCLKHSTKKENVSHKEFYELFYKEKHNTKKDYLFRNEMRVLNNLIYDFIIEKEAKAKIKEEKYFSKELFLKHLLNRNSNILFEKEIKKVFLSIEEKQDYKYSYSFTDLWTKYKSSTLEISNSFFEDTTSFYWKTFNFWKFEVAHKTKNLELFKAFIDRAKISVDRNATFDDRINFLDFSKITNNPFIDFLDNKILSYKKFDIEKIDLLKKCLEDLDVIPNHLINISKEKFTLLQTIGIEYMILGNNKEAILYLEKSLQIGMLTHKELKLKGLYNFLSCTIKLKDFKKAINLFNEHKEEILESNISESFVSIFTMCFIFINEVEKAENLNKIVKSSNSVDTYIYSRCNLAIIHYLNNEKELALNELLNINQSLSYHKNQDKVYPFFILTFKNFIQNTLNKNLKLENLKYLQKLLLKLNESISKSSIKYGGDSLHVLWLKNEISKNISS